MADTYCEGAFTNPDLSNSILCAAAILASWHENNLEKLQRTLADAATLPTGSADSAGEGERLELLAGIASEMRRMIASGEVQQATVYAPLLRHLAKPILVQTERAYFC
jgi:hypothetical protein